MLPSPLSPSEESIPPKFTFSEVAKTASNSSRPRLIPQEDPSIFPHVRQVGMGSTSTSAIASLISWKDPSQSLPVFCCVLLVLLSLSFCSLISVLAYSGLILLAVTTFARFYSYNMVRTGRKELGYDALVKVSNMSVSLPPSLFSAWVPTITSSLNTWLAKARSLLLLENPVFSSFSCLSLYLLAHLGSYLPSWCNLLTLATLAWAGLFTLPIVFKRYKQPVFIRCEQQVNTPPKQPGQVSACNMTTIMERTMEDSSYWLDVSQVLQDAIVNCSQKFLDITRTPGTLVKAKKDE